MSVLLWFPRVSQGSARPPWCMARTLFPSMQQCPPRPPHDVPAVDLVIQRVESSSGIGLGRPVKRMLQSTDRAGTPDAGVGLATRALTGHSLINLRVNEAAALPITGGCVVRPARSVLRPPPTPFRPVVHFPAPHRL